MGKFFKFSLAAVFLLLLLISLAVCGGSFSSTSITEMTLSGIESGDDKFEINLVMQERENATVLVKKEMKLIARDGCNYNLSAVGFGFLINSVESFEKVLIELKLDDDVVSSVELENAVGNLEQTVTLEIDKSLRNSEGNTMLVNTESGQTLSIEISSEKNPLEFLIWGFNLG